MTQHSIGKLLAVSGVLILLISLIISVVYGK